MTWKCLIVFGLVRPFEKLELEIRFCVSQYLLTGLRNTFGVIFLGLLFVRRSNIVFVTVCVCVCFREAALQVLWVAKRGGLLLRSLSAPGLDQSLLHLKRKLLEVSASPQGQHLGGEPVHRALHLHKRTGKGAGG